MLDRYATADLDLDALCAAAVAVLGASAAEDGRVQARPDPRTIRYYQTLGIVDRPRYEGREARYGYRHLLQIVAVKLLQARGHSLAQAQAALAGLPTERLDAAVRADLGVVRPVAPVATPRPLLAVELMPGVVITVDPAKVADPHALIALLTRTLGVTP